MENDTKLYEDFLLMVDPAYQGFIMKTHDSLLGSGYIVKIKPAKNGFCVSYSHSKAKKVIINFVFRKSGLMIRIYGEHQHEYSGFFESLPTGMRQSIEKATVCKALTDPEAGNTRCKMGYDFMIGDKRFQKCRYSSFMFAVNEENMPFIKTFVDNEVKARAKELA